MSPADHPDIRLWWGILLFVAVLGFLVYVFVRHPKLTDDQRTLMRFFSSICAGLSGYLITGQALLNFSQKFANGALAIEGTGGAAFFFLIWLTSGKATEQEPVFNITLLPGMSFESAARLIAQTYGAVVDFTTMAVSERLAPLRGEELHCKNALAAIGLLGNCAVSSSAISPYSVKQDDGKITISPKG